MAEISSLLFSSRGVTLSASGPVARIVIANAPLNVLTVAVREALFEAACTLERHTEVRVVVIEAEGSRAFSVGSDIREFPKTELGGVAKIRFEQYLLDRIARLPQVVIAKIGGLTLGGGGELMLACDLRVASTDATFGFPEIKLGALPLAGGVKRLVREIGPVRTREFVYTGRTISAERAFAIGLINEVVEPGELDARVNALAAEIARLPGEALRLAKDCVAAALPSGAIDTKEAEAFGALYASEDLAEGLSAFIEKRPPEFNR
jgi:enoyl-CoA hydratase/carnithine racemase